MKRAGRRGLLYGIALLLWLTAAAGRADMDDGAYRLELFDAMTQGLVEAEAAARVSPARPAVALTFDDGPGEHTAAIASLLWRYGGRGTFFVVGSRVEKHRETLRQVVALGNEIGTHTWSHKDLAKLDAGDIRSQVTQPVGAVLREADAPVTLMRPPYGHMNELVRQVCAEEGLPLVLWSVDTRDWATRNADKIAAAILDGARDGSIILCHDVVPQTAEAMEVVIPELVRRGYQLVTVSELFAAKGITPQAGVVYRSVQ